MGCKTACIGDVAAYRKTTVKPLEGTLYNCYSLPAFDNNRTPETLDGSAILSSKLHVEKGDILVNKLNMRFKRIWPLHSLKPNSICSTEFMPLVPNDSIDPRYLLYVLTSDRFTNRLSGMRTGTSGSHQRVKPEWILEYSFPLPDMIVQERIGSVLGTIDEKIALNNQLNGYLAALGEAIATRHSNEADGTLDDICNQSKEAVSFDSAQLETYVSTENLLPNKAGLQLSAGLPTSGKVTRYRKGDTLVANIRPYFKKIWYATDEGTCSGDVIVFRANDVRYAPYVFFSLFCDEFFKYVMLGAKGTKMPRGDKKQMMTFPICTNCNSTDLQLLHELASMIGTNHAESRQLARLRDVLLPELMSGEIDVSKVDLTQLNSHLGDC